MRPPSSTRPNRACPPVLLVARVRAVEEGQSRVRARHPPAHQVLKLRAPPLQAWQGSGRAFRVRFRVRLGLRESV
jgi:hypothetical protein